MDLDEFMPEAYPRLCNVVLGGMLWDEVPNVRNFHSGQSYPTNSDYACKIASMSKPNSVKRSNQKRQPRSMKVWQDETNGYVWESVHVHHGRVTTMVRGPLGKQLNVAHEFLKAVLKGDVPT